MFSSLPRIPANSFELGRKYRKIVESGREVHQFKTTPGTPFLTVLLCIYTYIISTAKALTSRTTQLCGLCEAWERSYELVGRTEAE